MPLRRLLNVAFSNTAGMPTAIAHIPQTAPAAPLPWSPASLGSSMIGWYEADSNVLASGRLAQLTDLSTAGNHLTQTTASYQPLVTASVKSGHSGFSCDGVIKNNAEVYNAVFGTPTPFDLGTPFSILLAFEKGTGTLSNDDNGGREQTLSCRASAFSGEGWEIETGALVGNRLTFLVGNSYLTAQASSTALVPGSFYLALLTYNGQGMTQPGNFSVTVNGTAQTMVIGGSGIQNLSGGTMLAANQHLSLLTCPVAPFHPQFAQSSDTVLGCLLLNRAATATESAALLDYYNSKYLIY